MKSSTQARRSARLFCVWLLGGLGLLAPAMASAHDWYADDHAGPRSGISLGGRAAYYHSRDQGAVDQGWYGGAQLRFHFSPAIAAEGAVDYRKTNGVDFYPVQASLLAYLTPQYRLTPYILGGAGWYFVNDGGNHNRFGPHAGAGLQLFLSEHWSVDGSWRYVWIEDVGSGSNIFNKSYGGNGWMATGALNYHF